MTQVKSLMGTGSSPLNAQAIVGGVSNTQTATGSSSQANSFAISESITVFTTAPSNSGARLPPGSNPGDSFWIMNGDANTMLIYPPTGGKLNNGTANSSVSLPTVKPALCISIDGTSYIVNISA